MLFEPPSQLPEDELEEELREQANSYLMTELVDADVTTSKVTFPPAQSGWYGFRSDRVDEISGRQCRAYAVADLELVSEKRTEHLSQEDLAWLKRFSRDARQGRIPPDFKFPERASLPPPEREPPLTFDEYERADPANGIPHLGRPMRLTSKRRPLKATVWMCDSDEWPIRTDILLRLVTVLTPAGKHIGKLERFLKTRMPQGFPLKLDVPVL